MRKALWALAHTPEICPDWPLPSHRPSRGRFGVPGSLAGVSAQVGGVCSFRSSLTLPPVGTTWAPGRTCAWHLCSLCPFLELHWRHQKRTTHGRGRPVGQVLRCWHSVNTLNPQSLLPGGVQLWKVMGTFPRCPPNIRLTPWRLAAAQGHLQEHLLPSHLVPGSGYWCLSLHSRPAVPVSCASNGERLGEVRGPAPGHTAPQRVSED